MQAPGHTARVILVHFKQTHPIDWLISPTLSVDKSHQPRPGHLLSVYLATFEVRQFPGNPSVTLISATASSGEEINDVVCQRGGDALDKMGESEDSPGRDRVQLSTNVFYLSLWCLSKVILVVKICQHINLLPAVLFYNCNVCSISSSSDIQRAQVPMLAFTLRTTSKS